MLSKIHFRYGIYTLLFSLLCIGLSKSIAPQSSIAAPNLQTTVPDPATRDRINANYGKLPLSFEVNLGQTDKQVKFLSRGNGYSLFLTPTQVVLALSKPVKKLPQQSAKSQKQLEGAVVRIQWIGANQTPQVVGLNTLPGKSNYFRGKDPKQWQTNIPNYAKVQYQSVYPGIDLVYYGNQRQLEYDWVVAAGADLQQIRMKITGVNRLSVDKQGNLVLHTNSGELRQHRPRIYQSLNSQQKAVAGKYVLLNKQEVGFAVPEYDRSKSLVIDPVLSYSTYLGGNGNDQGADISVDWQGNAYITGRTSSTDFPTEKPLQTSYGGGENDTFVVKLNRKGRAFIYSTYLGGSGDDQGSGIVVDKQGNAYVTGITSSTNFPTANALQATNGGQFDAFVTKLNSTGSSLVYSTYLGGSENETDPSRSFSNITVDLLGSAYVVGTTSSNNFPTTALAFQRTKSGPNDIFVAKLNPSGSALVYSTYLGGSHIDVGNALAIDIIGNAYISGTTYSTNFPTTVGAFQTNCQFGDVIVAKLNQNGSKLFYSTCLGGNNFDFGGGIAVGDNGSAYITGNTVSNNFPTTPGAFQQSLKGDRDAFVTKLNPKGSHLIYSTYLGGNSGDGATDITVDRRGNAFVTGGTQSKDFPTFNPLQAACNSNAFGDCWDAFVTKFKPTGSAISFSTFLGGSAVDDGVGIALSINNRIYVTGETFDTNDFPTVNPLQATRGGARTDAFVLKIKQTDHYWDHNDDD
jgi:Beta-propeller repeat